MISAVLMIAGCSKESSINFLDSDKVIDNQAHTLVLNTDISITNVFIKSYIGDESTNISNELTDGGSRLVCQGEWFTAVVNTSAAKKLNLSISANDTGKERRLEITVKHRCFQPSTIEVVQKQMP